MSSSSPDRVEKRKIEEENEAEDPVKKIRLFSDDESKQGDVPKFNFLGGANTVDIKAKDDGEPAKGFSFSLPDSAPKFSFGSVPATASAVAPSDSTAAPKFSFGAQFTAPASSGFTFTFNAPSKAAGDGGSGDEGDNGEETDESGAGAELKVDAESAGEPKGERIEVVTGEEDEDRRFSSKAKMLQLDGAAWRECGVGQLRLLVHKETGSARLLLRAEGSLRAIMNERLFAGMKVEKRQERAVMFVAVKPMTGMVPSAQPDATAPDAAAAAAAESEEKAPPAAPERFATILRLPSREDRDQLFGLLEPIISQKKEEEK